MAAVRAARPGAAVVDAAPLRAVGPLAVARGGVPHDGAGAVMTASPARSCPLMFPAASASRVKPLAAVASSRVASFGFFAACRVLDHEDVGEPALGVDA